MGPLTGGWLLEHFWWGSIFLVNVPVIAVALVGAVFLVPESRDPHAPPLDIGGVVLSIVGLFGLLYGIIEGPARGWTDPVVLGAFAVAAVFLTTFVIWEARSKHPLLDVTFFKNPRFTAASLAVTLVFFAMFGSLFFLSQYLQFVLDYDPLQAGLALIPVAASLMIAAPISAKIVAWIGTKIVVTAGLLVVAAGMVLMSAASVSSSYWLIAGVLVTIGLGMGLAMAPATDSIMGSLPPERAGVGSAMNDTTREIGGALGVAILGSITASSYASSITGNPLYPTLAKQSPQAAATVANSIGGAAAVAAKLPASAAEPVLSASKLAFVDALDQTVIVGAAVAVAGAIIAAVFLPSAQNPGSRRSTISTSSSWAPRNGCPPRIAAPSGAPRWGSWPTPASRASRTTASQRDRASRPRRSSAPGRPRSTSSSPRSRACWPSGRSRTPARSRWTASSSSPISRRTSPRPKPGR